MGKLEREYMRMEHSSQGPTDRGLETSLESSYACDAPHCIES